MYQLYKVEYIFASVNWHKHYKKAIATNDVSWYDLAGIH